MILQYGTQLHERFGDNMDTIIQLMDYKFKVDRGSEGEKHEFHHEFVRELCSKTIKEWF